jgi:acetyl-CoA carboxylase carboxyltransferase component
MPLLSTSIDTRSEIFVKNREDMIEALAEINAIQEEGKLGGGQKAIDRLIAKGKLPARERIAKLLDPDSPFMEISPMAGYMTHYKVGGGAIVGIGVISGVECVVMAHDPSDMGGAMTQLSWMKMMRALELARVNRLPYIQIIESAGGDLRRGGQGIDPEWLLKSELNHFGDTGRLFHEITELSKLGVPTVSVVCGSSTAGGAYMPGLSEYTVFIKKAAQVFLAGPPLLRMATGEIAKAEELGGADMHASKSGLADYIAEDETEGFGMARDIVAHLNWTKKGPGPSKLEFDAPLYDREELLGMVSKDLKAALDIREVIARIVDGSEFEEFKPVYSPSMVCGWAHIHGFPVGILGNNGPIFSETAQKSTQFIQLCNARDIPLIFLHNITGYMVGKQYEEGGIVKHGSQMINAISNSAVPHISVIVGASYGAGNYGMSGRSFDTRFLFFWPTAKIAVMGPQQIAGVMSLVRRGQAAARGIEIDEEKEAKLVAEAAAYQEYTSLAKFATGRVKDDGIIDPRDTREALAMALSATHSNDVKGAEKYGSFRF